jgi:hypothetical protein
MQGGTMTDETSWRKNPSSHGSRNDESLKKERIESNIIAMNEEIATIKEKIASLEKILIEQNPWNFRQFL